MKRARPRGFKQVGSRVSADSAIASIEAETMQGARIELTPKVDPDTFIYKNKILLPYELDTVILRARARNSTSLVFVHCMDPRQDKRAISFVKMLTPKRQASRKILSRREGSAVKLQAALRGSISRSKFKELHTLREESMKQMRATFPSRVWAAAKTKVADHLKVLKAAPEEHFSSVQVAARAIKMALKFNMTNAATFFAELDKDQSGDISTAELVNGLRDLGLPAFSQAQCDSCCRHLALIWDAPIQGELESLAAALGAKNDRFTYTNFRHFLGENALRQHEGIFHPAGDGDGASEVRAQAAPRAMLSALSRPVVVRVAASVAPSAVLSHDPAPFEILPCLHLRFLPDPAAFLLLRSIQKIIPDYPPALQPLIHHLVEYYGELRLTEPRLPEERDTVISRDRFISCCTTLRIASAEVALAAYSQLSPYSQTIPPARLWHCLWFTFVRMLSDSPLALRYTHEWKYEDDVIMKEAMECLHPLLYNIKSASLVTNNRLVWREKALQRKAQEQSESSELAAIESVTCERDTEEALPLTQACYVRAKGTTFSEARSPDSNSSPEQSGARRGGGLRPAVSSSCCTREARGKLAFPQQSGCQLWRTGDRPTSQQSRVDGSRLSAGEGPSQAELLTPSQLTPQWLSRLPSRDNADQAPSRDNAAQAEGEERGGTIDESRRLGSTSVGSTTLDFGPPGEAHISRVPLRVQRECNSLPRDVGVALARNYRHGYQCKRSPADGGLPRASSLAVLPRHRVAPSLYQGEAASLSEPSLAPPAPTRQLADSRDCVAAIQATFSANQKPTARTPIHAAPKHRPPPKPQLPPRVPSQSKETHSHIKYMRHVWASLAEMESPGAATVPGGIWDRYTGKKMPPGVSAVLQANRLEQATCYIPRTIPVGQRPKAFTVEANAQANTPKPRRRPVVNPRR
ncbi:MAG: hypothetical protein SGPRY_002086 [Prymnesium sp.]